MATLRIKIATVLVALGATVALGACGNETEPDQASESTSDSPTETPTETSSDTTAEPGALPECTDVWIDGQDLPKDYKACTTDGETIKPVRHTCGYGATFFEHEGRFFALKGNVITDAGDLETDEEYQQLLTTCQA